MTKDDLLNKFKKGSAARSELVNHLKKSWARRAVKLRDDAGVSNNNQLIPGYHYLVCPITECPVYAFGKPYSDKLGITMKEFYVLFPEFDGVTSSPFNVEARKAKQEETKQKNAIPITINGKTHDLNVVKSKMNTRNIREKYGSIENCVEGYHYITCPVTGLPTMGFNKYYFENLLEGGITKDDFISEFPSIDLELNKSTPEYRGIILSEFNSGVVKKEHADTQRINEANEFKKNNPNHTTRNMHMDIEELVEYIMNGGDPIINNYLYGRQRVPTLEKLSDEVGIPEDKLVENYHYVIHPISGFPMSRIGVKSIEVFGITEDRFYEWFPHLKNMKISAYSTEKIKQGLMREDENGVRPIDRSTKGRIKKFSEVLDNGKTYQEIITEKTKQAHLTNIDEYGRNGYQRLADINITKSIITKNNDVVDTEYGRYRNIVLFIMARLRPYFAEQNIEYMTWNKREYDGEVHHQVDHKFSIAAGFENRISPLCIANFDNLEILTGNENTEKGNGCSITINDLEQMNGMSLSEMQDEFERIMNVVRRQIADEELSTTMTTLIEAGHDIALKVKPYNEFYRKYKDGEYDAVKHLS